LTLCTHSRAAPKIVFSCIFRVLEPKLGMPSVPVLGSRHYPRPLSVGIFFRMISLLDIRLYDKILIIRTFDHGPVQHMALLEYSLPEHSKIKSPVVSVKVDSELVSGIFVRDNNMVAIRI